MSLIKGTLFVVCWLLSSTALALRCDRQIIEQGDSKQEVYDLCGEPDTFSSHWERRGNNRHADITEYGFNPNQPYPYHYPNHAFNYGQNHYEEVEILVDEWVYNFGRSRFKQYLKFENGRLVQVTDLDRGYDR